MMFRAIHLAHNFLAAPAVSLPILLGYLLLRRLPKLHGDFYPTADVLQTIRIGWLGAALIAPLTGFVLLTPSLFRFCCRDSVNHGPSRSLALSRASVIRAAQALTTCGGFLAIQCVCMLQGVVGAFMIEYVDGREPTSMGRRLDPVQAALAGAVGAIVIQVALWSCTPSKPAEEQADVKAKREPDGGMHCRPAQVITEAGQRMTRC